MQSRVVKLAKQGAPSVMTVETVELGMPGPDEVLIISLVLITWIFISAQVCIHLNCRVASAWKRLVRLKLLEITSPSLRLANASPMPRLRAVPMLITGPFRRRVVHLPEKYH